MAIFTVTSLEDAATGSDPYTDGKISLREAVDLANSSDGADTIIFDAGLSGVITLTEGVIRTTDQLTLSGTGVITISGDVNGDDTLTADDLTDLSATTDTELDDNTQLFLATSDLTLEGLTLTGGRVGASNQSGGALRVSGDLIVTDTVIAGNSAVGSNASGGGFIVSGDVTITDSVISGNSVSGSSVSGGGFKAFGDVTITSSVLRDNSAGEDDASGTRANGGGFETYGQATVIDSTITGNNAAGGSVQGGAFKAYKNVTISNSNISDNTGQGGNVDGGAVTAYENVTITNSTISGNRADGGLSQGGAIVASKDLMIANSAVSGNHASGFNASGGAFKVYDNATFINSTISGNSVEGSSASGGAFRVYDNTTITSSTLSGNSATGIFARGGALSTNSQVSIGDTILLGNFATDGNDEIITLGAIVASGHNIIGADNDAFDVTSVTGDDVVINADPSLVFAETEDNNGVLAGVLADNGGDVETIALLAVANNPALDASNATGVDARGMVRASDLVDIDNGGASDLGAFELQANGVLPVKPQVTSNATVDVAENETIIQTLAVQGFADGGGLTFSILPGGDGALFAIDPATGVLSFLAARDFETPMDTNGDNIYDVTVEVEDGDGGAARQTLAVSVTDVNEAPMAETSVAETDEDQTLTSQLVATDVDGDDLTFALSEDGDVFSGSLSLDADGSFTYTPDADFNGEDSFVYEVSDGQGGRTTQFLTLTVKPVNDAPIFADTNVGGVEDLSVDSFTFCR